MNFAREGSVEHVMNSVKVVLRIVGSTAHLLEVEHYLSNFGGQVVQNPISGSVPEAWWCVEITRDNQESTEPAISDVLAALTQLCDRNIKISDDPRFALEVDCTVTIETERPVIEVSRDSVKRLAACGASLGFDVYDYRE
jgi:hypothetical protein